MRDYLVKKSYPTSEVVSTINRLKELDLINDKKFTSELILARSHSKPKGKKALIIELKRKGIDAEDLDIDEDELAKKALEKKKPRSFEQASRFLYSRGFSWNTIERTLKNWYNSTA